MAWPGAVFFQGLLDQYAPGTPIAEPEEDPPPRRPDLGVSVAVALGVAACIVAPLAELTS